MWTTFWGGHSRHEDLVRICLSFFSLVTFTVYLPSFFVSLIAFLSLSAPSLPHSAPFCSTSSVPPALALNHLLTDFLRACSPFTALSPASSFKWMRRELKSVLAWQREVRRGSWWRRRGLDMTGKLLWQNRLGLWSVFLWRPRRFPGWDLDPNETSPRWTLTQTQTIIPLVWPSKRDQINVFRVCFTQNRQGNFYL